MKKVKRIYCLYRECSSEKNCKRKYGLQNQQKLVAGCLQQDEKLFHVHVPQCSKKVPTNTYIEGMNAMPAVHLAWQESVLFYNGSRYCITRHTCRLHSKGCKCSQLEIVSGYGGSEVL